MVIFLITSLFSTFSNIGTGGLGSLAASTYLADDQDINQAELTYTEWETDLQMEIDRVESDRPGYDEYRYNLGAIEHDPYVLMGYLTSAYQDLLTMKWKGAAAAFPGTIYPVLFRRNRDPLPHRNFR